jgi:hypothetical protein
MVTQSYSLTHSLYLLTDAGLPEHGRRHGQHSGTGSTLTLTLSLTLALALALALALTLTLTLTLGEQEVETSGRFRAAKPEQAGAVRCFLPRRAVRPAAAASTRLAPWVGADPGGARGLVVRTLTLTLTL